MPLTYGIEIEFIAPSSFVRSQQVAEALRRATDMTVVQALRQTRTVTWKVVSDASLEGNGFEAVSPVLRQEAFSEVDTICRALSSLGASVNRSCGMHVHIGAEGLSLDAMKRLAIVYAESEEFIDKLLPPSRRGNG